MKTIALGFLATVIAASSALAGDEVMNKDYKQPVTPVPCFRDQELQLDFFGSFMNFPYGTYEESRERSGEDRLDRRFDRREASGDRNGGGGGVGVNYFFMRYIGIGVDGDFDSNRNGVANYTGKLILRLPIEVGGFCIAPYVFGGGGGESFFGDDNSDDFHGRGGNRNSVGTWMTGGGLEWRITPRFGLFVEGRYTWAAGGGDHGINNDNDRARLGLRVAF